MDQRIGGYVVEREIGRCGIGVVYLARNERLDHLLAIKALPKELDSHPILLERFEREGTCTAIRLGVCCLAGNDVVRA